MKIKVFLDHDAITPNYGGGHEDKYRYIMEFINGRTFVIYTYRETEIGEGKIDPKPFKNEKKMT
jgi:hypothetical protein